MNKRIIMLIGAIIYAVGIIGIIIYSKLPDFIIFSSFLIIGACFIEFDNYLQKN